jgi:hypothetical protein
VVTEPGNADAGFVGCLDDHGAFWSLHGHAIDLDTDHLGERRCSGLYFGIHAAMPAARRPSNDHVQYNIQTPPEMPQHALHCRSCHQKRTSCALDLTGSGTQQLKVTRMAFAINDSLQHDASTPCLPGTAHWQQDPYGKSVQCVQAFTMQVNIHDTMRPILT